MKLSTIFAIFTVSEGKRYVAPDVKLERLRGHIDFVWGKWFQNCALNPNIGDGRKTRFITLVNRVETQYGNCGSDPDATRKRRETEENNPQANDSEEEWDERFRLSRTDKNKAVKQLSNILTRFGKDHLFGCTRGLTSSKIEGKAKKIRDNMLGMGCSNNDRFL